MDSYSLQIALGVVVSVVGILAVGLTVLLIGMRAKPGRSSSHSSLLGRKVSFLATDTHDFLDENIDRLAKYQGVIVHVATLDTQVNVYIEFDERGIVCERQLLHVKFL